MNSIVLDTNILIDHIHGFAPWLKSFLKAGNVQLVIPTIVVAEYLNATQVETKLGQKRSKEYLSWFVKQDLTEDIAKILGTLLRRKTYPQGAGLADLIIASTAIFLNAKLATNNMTDFKNIPNLKFFDPK